MAKEANPAPVALAKPVDPKEAMKALTAKLVNPENQRKCTYVDADGVEYPARMLPVAVNKGTLIKIPCVSDIAGEFQKIGNLPLERQADALADLHKRMNSTIQALKINNEIRILAEYKDELCYTTDWNGAKVPVADLIVEFSKKDGVSNRKCLSRVLTKESVGTPPAGKKGKPHFYVSE